MSISLLPKLIARELPQLTPELLHRLGVLAVLRCLQEWQQGGGELDTRAIDASLAEFGADGLPVLCNANFGHTEPMFVLPYGAMAEIDPVNKTFTIMEPAVVNEQL